MTEPALRGCPFILETPGSDEERAVDLERLRRLREGL
jgi:endonuclease IV